MSTNENDYSDYISYLLNINNGLSLFCGLIFTAITLLLTGVHDLSNIWAQLILAALAGLFDLFIFLWVWNHFDTLPLCKHVPPLSTRDTVFSMISVLGFCLWSLTIVMMFLLFKLTYVALASVLFLGFTLVGILFLYQTSRVFKKRHS